MFGIVNMFRGIFGKMRQAFVILKDRVAGVEIEKKYGNQSWAQRNPKTRHDLEAPKINANVYIATRAISDAIKSLPVNIVTVENVQGIEREIDDNDHEANDLLLNPNPEHSWSDIIDHVVKSYLNDGNAILTIERMTGPNGSIELWPRDPRSVNINTSNRSYRFGSFSRTQKVYPRSRVVHIRDMDVEDPFWGIGRINTIREEIMMDYHINKFNSNFFRYGATLNLMFTPDDNLSEDQHQQILDALSDEIGGADKAFKIFVNRYAGKFESPEQKHKDISFLDLLKHNREKIFGVFGLPPFRGGVMEFANYANALAQDKDFWLNTIKPILKVIEDSLNKQLLWPIYGVDIRLKFDLDSVPAIKGDQNAIEERLLKLESGGIVSAAYVREKLGIDETAAPVEDSTPVNETVPERDEQEEVENALFQVLKLQRQQVLVKVKKLTAGGTLMSVLCDPETQVPRMYNTTKASKAIQNRIQPKLRKLLMARGVKMFTDSGLFDMNHKSINGLIRQTTFRIEDMVEQNTLLLKAVFDDADRYGWTYRQLEKSIKGVFSLSRAQDMTKTLLTEFISNTVLTLKSMKNESMTLALVSQQTTKQVV